jgi:hypothetical protein
VASTPWTAKPRGMAATGPTIPAQSDVTHPGRRHRLAPRWKEELLMPSCAAKTAEKG